MMKLTGGRSKKGELVEALKLIEKSFTDDPEKMHKEADKALLKFIDDKEISEIFTRCAKWHG